MTKQPKRAIWVRQLNRAAREDIEQCVLTLMNGAGPDGWSFLIGLDQYASMHEEDVATVLGDEVYSCGVP